MSLPSSIMTFLEMTRGGLVFDAEVARRVGEFLIEAHGGRAELEHQLPLEILDKGKSWQIEGGRNRNHEPEGEGALLMSVRKFDGAVSDFRFSRGILIESAELAQRLGELLWEAHHGAAERQNQQPFTAVDKGDYWRVDGSRNRDRKVEGLGAFYMSVNKRDGCVTDFGSWYILHPPPEVQAIIEAAQRRKNAGKID
jgi:NTF2 fold immunity protein of polymorphic toxin system component